MKTIIKIHTIDNRKARNLKFLDFIYIEKKFKKENYVEVYSYEENVESLDINYIIDNIFNRFNFKRPLNFKEQYLISISDIIQVNNKFFYVNEINFEEVTKFW